MTSRSTSHTKRPPSSTSTHQPRTTHPTTNTAHINPSTSISTSTSTHTNPITSTSRRHLGYNAPRKPPPGTIPPAPRRPAHRDLSAGSAPAFQHDGTSDTASATQAEEDVIISRPAFLFDGHAHAHTHPHAVTGLPEKVLSPTGRATIEQAMTEPMTLLKAHNAALARADAAGDTLGNAVAAAAVGGLSGGAHTGDWPGGYGDAGTSMLGATGLGSPRPGQMMGGGEAAIEMFKRRVRERQAQVEGVGELDGEGEEQEVLKRALWDCLRKRVEGLEEDWWMFEVEVEGWGQGG